MTRSGLAGIGTSEIFSDLAVFERCGSQSRACRRFEVSNTPVSPLRSPRVFHGNLTPLTLSATNKNLPKMPFITGPLGLQPNEKHPSVSSMGHRSNSRPNAHKSPSKFPKADVPAPRTTAESRNERRPDGHTARNGSWLPRDRRATASNARARCPQIAPTPPPQPQPSLPQDTRPRGVPDVEARRNERMTTLRHMRQERTSTTPSPALGCELPRWESPPRSPA